VLALPDRAEVVEVGLRDGLQTLPRVVPTAVKLRLLEALLDAGLTRLEVTAFARPDVLPQLADGAELLARAPRRPGVVLRALAPNGRGARRALDAGAGELLAVVCCSEAYSLRNQRMTVRQSLDEALAIARLAAQAGVPVTVGLGLAFFCPYEGDTPPGRVLELVGELRAGGIDRVYVATSAGMADPAHVAALTRAILSEHPGTRLGIHLHDTNGMGLANALAAADAGVRTFEGSVGGLGGGIAMPAALPGCGNVATEDLVAMLEQMGVATGIDVGRLRDAGRVVADALGVPSRSRLSHVGTKADVLARTRAAGPTRTQEAT
jgi:hydroxymethylglutaryl-CoA lyase